jgi:hypothetical protein
MSRYAARVGATLPGGVQELGAMVAGALEEELANEDHGPIEVLVWPYEHAHQVMADIGVTVDSPARAFLARHPGGVLVTAMAEVFA